MSVRQRNITGYCILGVGIGNVIFGLLIPWLRGSEPDLFGKLLPALTFIIVGVWIIERTSRKTES